MTCRPPGGGYRGSGIEGLEMRTTRAMLDAPHRNTNVGARPAPAGNCLGAQRPTEQRIKPSQLQRAATAAFLLLLSATLALTHGCDATPISLPGPSAGRAEAFDAGTSYDAATLGDTESRADAGIAAEASIDASSTDVGVDGNVVSDDDSGQGDASDGAVPSTDMMGDSDAGHDSSPDSNIPPMAALCKRTSGHSELA